MAEARKLICLDCGQANRVPFEKLSDKPKCGICGAALISGKVASLDAQTLSKAAKGDDVPLLVDFWAPWCGPCRQMAPQFEQAAKMFGADVRLAKIDTQAHPKVSQTYRVQGIPAFILFHKGREIARFAGLRPAGQLVAEVRSKLPRAQ